MRRWGPAAAAFAMVLITSVPAAGHPRAVLDGDDSDGPLDLAGAQHNHQTIAWSGIGTGGMATSVRFKLATYERWTYEAIEGSIKRWVGVEIDLDNDRKVDRCLMVRAHVPPDGTAALGYSVTIYKGCNYFDDRLVKSYGSDQVSRPDEHSIRVHVPKKALLGRGVKTYRWRALTSFEEQRQNSACSEPEDHADGGYGTCVDFTRWKRHSF